MVVQKGAPAERLSDPCKPYPSSSLSRALLFFHSPSQTTYPPNPYDGNLDPRQELLRRGASRSP